MKKRIYITAVLFCAFGAALFAQFTPTAAVLPFQAPGLSERDVTVLTESFRGHLVESGAVNAFTRAEVDKAIAETGGVSNVESALLAGRALNARYVFYGVLTPDNGLYSLTINMLDTTTSSVAASSTSAVSGRINTLSRTLRGMANELVPEAKMANLGAGKGKSAVELITTTLETNKSYLSEDVIRRMRIVSDLITDGERSSIYNSFKKGGALPYCLLNVATAGLGVGSFIQGDYGWGFAGLACSGVGFGGLAYGLITKQGAGYAVFGVGVGVGLVIGAVRPWFYASGYNEKLTRLLRMETRDFGGDALSMGNAYRTEDYFGARLFAYRF